MIQNGAGEDDDRSAKFHSVVAQLKKRRWSVEAIAALFEKYSGGVARKYAGRIREEVTRSYDKIPDSAAPPGTSTSTTGATVRSGGYTLRTIRVIPGQLPRVASETEQALLAAGVPIFSRAGTLVHPIIDTVSAADGRQTKTGKLRPFCADSLLDRIADVALFQRHDGRRKAWVNIDPPYQVATTLLSREGHWTVSRINGVITTPTLRPDGSLLSAKGYDVATQLYHHAKPRSA